MLQDGVTWFLLADGRRARVLIEARRGAALSEPADWVMMLGPEDGFEIQDRPARSFDSMGAGRHAMDGGRNLHEEEEARFLARVAARIGEADKRRAFDHLAIAAPPRALGVLRAALPENVKARVRAELAKDVLDDDTDALRARLTELLRPIA